jgi:hypothetical protein
MDLKKAFETPFIRKRGWDMTFVPASFAILQMNMLTYERLNIYNELEDK